MSPPPAALGGARGAVASAVATPTATFGSTGGFGADGVLAPHAPLALVAVERGGVTVPATVGSGPPTIRFAQGDDGAEVGAWFGIVAGGGRLALPTEYVELVFARPFVRECMSKRPTPVDCAKQGAAARRPSPCEERGGVAVPTTVGSGAPTIRFAQGGADYCVPYALAVDFLGDAAHADEAARGPSIPRSRGVLVKTFRWESGVVWSGTPLPLPLPSKRHRKAASSILAVVL